MDYRPQIMRKAYIGVIKNKDGCNSWRLFAQPINPSSYMSVKKNMVEGCDDIS